MNTLSAQERFARELRGFGPQGFAAIIIILLGNGIVVPLSALLVLAWTRLSHTPWREIGYVRPRNWLVSTILALALGGLFKLVMKALVMPLLGAPPVNPAYHYLAGNSAALPFALFAIMVGAGFGEETLFRGYMFERFGKLFGSSARAKIAIILITSLWFGLDHYSMQGLAGAEQATIVGLVFGSIFAVTGRIWSLMCAHAAFDLVALALIYWDKETAVAHFIFR